MKEKKNPKFNLEKKRIMFLQFGLIFSFMLVLTAFEHKIPFEEPKDVYFDVLDEVDMLIPVTYREQEKTIEPPQVKKIILLNPVVVDDIEVDIDYNPEDSFGNPDDEVPLLPVNNDIEEEEETPFVRAEYMPVFRPDRNKNFKEGNLDLFKTLQTSVKYPVAAQEACIQGKVFVRFVIAKTGDISNIQITRSVDPLLDNEVIRVLKNLPKFKPGMQRLKPVAVYYSAFVNFQLQ
jgi:protein TonB